MCYRGKSHPFLIITVCGVPVAKRNFLQRHGHGMVSTVMQLHNDVDNHSQPCASSWTTAVASDAIIIGELRRAVRFENTGDHLDASFAGPSYQEYPLDLREKKWLTLLHECPNATNPTCMTNWIDKVLFFSGHEMDTSRDAPSTMSCIDVGHVPLVSPTNSHSIYDSGISVAAMERPNIGLYTQSSTSSLGTGFGQTTQESAKVASEIAEFDDFMDGVDTSSVFV